MAAGTSGVDLLIALLVCGAFLLGLADLAERSRTGTYTLVTGYGSQRAAYSATGSTLGNYCRVGGGMMLACAGLLALARNQRLPSVGKELVCLLAIAVPAFLWFLHEYGFGRVKDGMLIAASPFIWIVGLAVFAGMEPVVWRWLDRLSGVIGLGFLCISTLEAIKVGLYSRPAEGSPLVMGLAWGYWFCIYFLFVSACKKGFTVLLADLLAIWCVGLAIYVQSRGWLLQCGLAIAIRWLVLRPSQREGPAVWRWVVGAGGFVTVAIASYWLVSTQAPAALDQLFERMGKDTRSGQYRAYFAHVELRRLVLGYGPEATYTTDELGRPYGNIDNQFLWIALKHGLVTLLAYGALGLAPGLRLLGTKGPVQAKIPGFVTALWCLSMAGVSIYAGIGFEPPFCFLLLLAGRSRLVLSQLKTDSYLDESSGGASPGTAVDPACEDDYGWGHLPQTVTDRETEATFDHAFAWERRSARSASRR